MHSSKWFLIAFALCAAAPNSVAAQQVANLQNQVRAYRVAHEKEIVQEFAGPLSLPNHATDVAGIAGNGEFINSGCRASRFNARNERAPESIGRLCAFGKEKIVIGGGDSALDCARTALRVPVRRGGNAEGVRLGDRKSVV